VGLKVGFKMDREPEADPGSPFARRGGGRSRGDRKTAVGTLALALTPGNQASKTSNPAIANPTTSKDQSPRSKPSNRPLFVTRTLTEPSNILVSWPGLFGLTASRRLVVWRRRQVHEIGAGPFRLHGKVV
jgi:hypothetical protein